MNKRLFAGIMIVGLIVFLGAFAPWITLNDASEMKLSERFTTPNFTHWMGQDQNGMDVFAQVAYGARLSLTISVAVTLISTFIGIIVGSLAGYIGGITEQVLMRLLDMVQAFPGFILALALVAALGPSIPNLIIAMCATGWSSYARLVRAEVLHLKHKDYVIGAVAAGASPLRLIVHHIWPNLAGLLTVQATFGMAGVILAESGLSFLGLGAPPEVPTWGALLNNGRRFLSEAPHIGIFAGLVILILVIGIHLLGEALRERLDPRA